MNERDDKPRDLGILGQFSIIFRQSDVAFCVAKCARHLRRTGADSHSGRKGGGLPPKANGFHQTGLGAERRSCAMLCFWMR